MYDAIVLVSGAVKGLSILGALDHLYEKKWLSTVKYYAGCSVGAIISYLLLIGYSPKEMFAYSCSKDIFVLFSTINLITLPDHYGVVDSNVLYKYLEEMTIAKIGYLPTFKELFDNFNKVLLCPAYNLTSTSSSVYFSYLTHPNMIALKAVCLSSNIPIFFSKAEYQGDLYIDGAFFDAFPIMKMIEVIRHHTQEKVKIVGVLFNHEHEQEYKINSLVDYLKSIITIKNQDNFTTNYIAKIKKALRETDDVDSKLVFLDTNVKALDFSLDMQTRLKMFKEGKDSIKKQFNI